MGALSMRRMPRGTSLAIALLAAVFLLAFASTAVGAVTRYDDDDPSVVYTPATGAWMPSTIPGHPVGHYDGYLQYSSVTNATATFSFTGTEVRYIAATWFNRGIAAVSVDGGPETMVDLYSPDPPPTDTNEVLCQQTVYTKTGLANGPHTITVRVTGTRNPSAGSPGLITVDAFDVTVPDPPVSTPASSTWTVAGLVLLGIFGASAALTRKRART